MAKSVRTTAYLDGKIITRNYAGLRGVDFSSDETMTSLYRSPYAVNVYKDYKSALGQAIETRPGFRILKHFEPTMVSTVRKQASVVKSHKFTFETRDYFIVQVNEFKTTDYVGKLYQWTNYPEETAVFSDLSYEVSTNAGNSFYYNGNYYLLDGVKIHRVKEVSSTVDSVTTYSLSISELADDAFIPTTYTIASDGTGTEYQRYNTLTGWQKNEFKANGSDTVFTMRMYYTDKNILSAAPNAVIVTVDGVTTTPSSIIYDYTSADFGKVTFSAAPSSGAVIVVQFYQTPDECEAYGCDKAVLFDNRVFFGNGSDKNKYLWSALNDISYIPDTNFEYAGKEDLEVASMVLMSNSFLIIKKGAGQNGYLYAVTSLTTEYDTMAKTYPNTLVSASMGAEAVGINYLNDIVYLSKQGLEAVEQLDLHNERNIAHRSSLVDGKLINESDLANAKTAIFRGYLCILVNGRIYLADYRQTYNNPITKSTEYEWFFWENIGVYEDGTFYKAVSIREHSDQLFIGTENGCLCVLNTDMLKMDDTIPIGTGELFSSAYQDEQLVTVDEVLSVDCLKIYSCWTTPFDEFEYRNYFKRCNKKGAMADLKSFSHSACTLAINTDYVKYTDLIRYNGGYFDFSDLDFEDFTFSTSARNTFYFKPKHKKWERISLKFYSDDLRKPFGIFGVTLEAFLMGYAKERN